MSTIHRSLGTKSTFLAQRDIWQKLKEEDVQVGGVLRVRCKVFDSGSWKMCGAKGRVDMFYSLAFWAQSGFLRVQLAAPLLDTA